MIFIDTGAFLARYLQRDQHHLAALDQWAKLRNDRRECYTSNYVIDETITLLARRSSYEFASQRAKNLFASKSLVVIRPNESDEVAALALFKKYADQQVSFTDCVSFALMQRARIQAAFTFDRHFALVGFQVEP